MCGYLVSCEVFVCDFDIERGESGVVSFLFFFKMVDGLMYGKCKREMRNRGSCLLRLTV